MTVYYSGYSNPNTSGTLGTSLVDLTSTSFADLIANAATYNGGVEYKKGTIVYNQNSSWLSGNLNRAIALVRPRRRLRNVRV